MIDHIGVAVSNMERAKAFYLNALRPLGIGVIMEVSAEETGAKRMPVSVPTGKRSSGSAQAGSPKAEPMSRSWRARAPRSTRSTGRRWPRADGTMARRGSGPTTMPITTAPSSSTLTATISKPCAIGQDEGAFSAASASINCACLKPPPASSPRRVSRSSRLSWRSRPWAALSPVCAVGRRACLRARRSIRAPWRA